MYAQLRMEVIRTAHRRFRSCKRCGSTGRNRHRSARVWRHSKGSLLLTNTQLHRSKWYTHILASRFKCWRKNPRLKEGPFKDDLRSDKHAVQNGVSRRNLDACAPHPQQIRQGRHAGCPVASWANSLAPHTLATVGTQISDESGICL